MQNVIPHLQVTSVRAKRFLHPSRPHLWAALRFFANSSSVKVLDEEGAGEASVEELVASEDVSVLFEFGMALSFILSKSMSNDGAFCVSIIIELELLVNEGHNDY